jgi:hypothetical protein
MWRSARNSRLASHTDVVRFLFSNGSRCLLHSPPQISASDKNWGGFYRGTTHIVSHSFQWATHLFPEGGDGSSTQAWMPTYVTILRIPQMIWVWRATVEWYWQGKGEELGEKPVPVPLCTPQIPHGLTRARTRPSAVRGRRLTTSAMARPGATHLLTEISNVVLAGFVVAMAEVNVVRVMWLILTERWLSLDGCSASFWEPGSSGIIVSDYGLEDRAIEFRSPAGAKDFSCSLCVQTGSGAHPASCTMGTGGSFPEAKRGRGVTLTNHPHLVPRSRMSRS